LGVVELLGVYPSLENLETISGAVPKPLKKISSEEFYIG
jgi:hypothetical protein